MTITMGHAAFAVTDLEKSLEFYCDKLGFKKGFALYNDKGDVWLQYVEFAPREYLELFPEAASRQYPDSGFKHLAFLVDDIQELIDTLKRKGVFMYDGPVKTREAREPMAKPAVAPCHSLTAWTADPDGNFIEFMQFTPESLHLHPENWK